MKRIFYVTVIVLCVVAHYFVAQEEMRRDENLLKVPPFTAVEHVAEVPLHENPVVDAPIDQVKSALLPLLDSESVEKAAALLKGASEIRAREIVDAIFSDEKFQISPLNRRLFVAAVATNYKDNPKDQAAFFEVLLKYPDLYKGEPYMYTLIVNDYEIAVPWVLNAFALWEKEKKFTLPEELVDLVLRAYTWIVERNDTRAVAYLLKGLIPLDPTIATKLLWQAASLPKQGVGFVSLLADKGADLLYAKDNHTALMKAVANNNLPFVQALVPIMVKQGVPVDVAINPEVGTALQIAIEKGFVAIELYLRSVMRSSSTL